MQLTWPNSVLFKRELLFCVPWRRAIASEPGRSSALGAQALVRVNSLGCRAQTSYGFSTVREDHGHAEIRVYTGLRFQVARPCILSISLSRFQGSFLFSPIVFSHSITLYFSWFGSRAVSPHSHTELKARSEIIVNGSKNCSIFSK